jgi:hypothetical protein
MKGRNIKWIMIKGGPSGRGKVNEEGKGGRIWSIYFLHMCECGTVKPVKVI